MERKHMESDLTGTMRVASILLSNQFLLSDIRTAFCLFLHIQWIDYVNNLGWIDSPALLIATYVRGTDEAHRRIRRNLLRYLVLTQAMVFRDISSCVKRRFPTMNHLVTAGLMTETELKEFDSVRSPHIKYWVPIQWAFVLLRKARESDMIASDIIYTDLLEKIDLYVPIMTILQFLFYIGWVKVAEVLLNPLGDDDDAKVHLLQLQRSRNQLDFGSKFTSRLFNCGRWIFYDDLIPQPLYTAESAQRTNNPMIGSCNDLITVAEDALLLKPRPRLMSTSTVISPTHKLSGEMDENGRIIVPVRNHNPIMRRCNSVDHYSDSNSSDHRNTRLLESLRRRFSKKRSRRGSTPSIISDLYYSHAPMGRSQLRNGISNGNGIANPGNMSRQSSICSSILYDGVQSPFQHSMVSNFTQSTRVATSGENVQLDATALNQSNDLRTEEETTNSDKLGQSWSVNEMLPIIEEDEREKGRHQSYYSTESGSNSSLSDSGLKKEDSPDIKSILNKSLSTINEESRSLSLGKEKSDVDLPQFAKTHSKNHIRRELDETVKLSVSNASKGISSSETDQAICNVMESVFIHGLMDAFFLKGSRYAKYPEPNFWPFVSKLTHGYIKNQINGLTLIKSEIGKARAWIRIVLNEHSLEHYLQLIAKDEGQLSNYYKELAFLRDGEKVEALIGYLKALARIPLDLPTNSPFLNQWSPTPLILAGLKSGKIKPDNEDDRLSVYSHPSLLDGVNDTTQRPIANILSSTPEQTVNSGFSSIQKEIGSEVIVQRRKGKIRRLSKSSSGTPSSCNISRDTSLSDIPTQIAFVEPIEHENPSNQAIVNCVSPIKEPADFKTTNEELEVEKTAAGNVTESEESVQLETLKDDFNEDLEENDHQIREADDREKPVVMSLHDELILAQSLELDKLNDSFITGNSLRGRLWSDSSSFREPIEHRQSTSSDSSYPPLVPFDSAMQAVLRKDSTMEETTTSSSAQRTKESSTTSLVEDQPTKDKTDAVVIEDDGLEETDQFGIKRCALKILTEIPQEHGLDSQDFRCWSCKKSIGGSFAPFKLCNLDSRLYCEECFKRGEDILIPARIILNWDCKPRPICHASKQFLRSIYDHPIIRIDTINPVLYNHAPTLQKIHQLRVKLSLLSMYLFGCKQNIAEDLKRRLWPHEYLYSDVHLYSDLEESISGVLERRLNTVIDFALGHVLHCPLCLQKGFVCEICKSRKVLYPFQTEIAHRCTDCWSVYHIDCFKQQDECPKCKRRKAFQAKDTSSFN
ncbi:RUN domain containing protein [Aphelenchoides besseyi]|nr:RUN domain containing protein [Aphelenchoides besseyi]